MTEAESHVWWGNAGVGTCYSELCPPGTKASHLMLRPELDGNITRVGYCTACCMKAMQAEVNRSCQFATISRVEDVMFLPSLPTPPRSMAAAVQSIAPNGGGHTLMRSMVSTVLTLVLLDVLLFLFTGVMVYPNCVEGHCGITLGSPFLAGKTPEEILERMQRR